MEEDRIGLIECSTCKHSFKGKLGLLHCSNNLFDCKRPLFKMYEPATTNVRNKKGSGDCKYCEHKNLDLSMKPCSECTLTSSGSKFTPIAPSTPKQEFLHDIKDNMQVRSRYLITIVGNLDTSGVEIRVVPNKYFEETLKYFSENFDEALMSHDKDTSRIKLVSYGFSNSMGHAFEVIASAGSNIEWR